MSIGSKSTDYAAAFISSLLICFTSSSALAENKVQEEYIDFQEFKLIENNSELPKTVPERDNIEDISDDALIRKKELSKPELEELYDEGVVITSDEEDHEEETILESEAQEVLEDEQDFAENYLLLKITSGKFTMNKGLSSYQINDELYLSFYEFVDSVYFPIEVFDEEQRAEGWFLEPDNKFYLNIKDKKLLVAGINKDLDKDDFRIMDEEIFISSNALKEWFGINFSLNFSQLTLDLEASDKFAFEEQYERENRWKKSQSKYVQKRKEYPARDLPYKMAEFPSTTVQLGFTSQSSEGKTEYARSHSIQGSGDLFKMSSDFFITGSDMEHISDARIRLYRYDNDGDIIPNTDIRQLEVGDVNAPSLNVVGGGGTERGIVLSNKPLGTVSNPDNFILSGEVEPGWEVEIYKNGEFVDFLSDTANGRYEFSNLELDAGMNLFKIVKYGPYGEKIEEFEKYFIGAGMIKEGELFYDFAITQPGQQVFPVHDEEHSFGLNSGHRLIGGVEYGVSENLSVGGGIYSGQVLDQIRNSAVLSARGSALGTYVRADRLQNNDNTSISQISARTNVADFNISGALQLNDGFEQSEEDLELFASGDIGRAINLFDLTNVSVRFGTDLEQYQSGKEVNSVSNQISTTIAGFAVSNSLDYQKTDANGAKNKNMEGEFFLRTRIDDFLTDSNFPFLLRTNLDYTVEPLAELTSLNVRLEKNLQKNLRLRFNAQHAFGDMPVTSYNADLNYDHDYFATSLSTSYTTEDEMAVALNLRFHIGPEDESHIPSFRTVNSAQSGTVVAKAFLDKNRNSTFDADDEPLEDVEFKLRGGTKALTNESGIAVIDRVTAHKKTDVTMSLETLPDIYYVPVNEGFSIVSRPGNVSEIEFPVVLGGEIDGIIELGGNVSDRELFAFDYGQVDVVVKDMNGEVVRTVNPDESGYYIVDRMMPGEFKVTLDEDSLLLVGAKNVESKTISIEEEDPIVTNIDFTIYKDITPIGPQLPAEASAGEKITKTDLEPPAKEDEIKNAEPKAAKLEEKAKVEPKAEEKPEAEKPVKQSDEAQNSKIEEISAVELNAIATSSGKIEDRSIKEAEDDAYKRPARKIQQTKPAFLINLEEAVTDDIEEKAGESVEQAAIQDEPTKPAFIINAEKAKEVEIEEKHDDAFKRPVAEVKAAKLMPAAGVDKTKNSDVEKKEADISGKIDDETKSVIPEAKNTEKVKKIIVEEKSDDAFKRKKVKIRPEKTTLFHFDKAEKELEEIIRLETIPENRKIRENERENLKEIREAFKNKNYEKIKSLEPLMSEWYTGHAAYRLLHYDMELENIALAIRLENKAEDKNIQMQRLQIVKDAREIAIFNDPDQVRLNEVVQEEFYAKHASFFY